MPGLDIDDLRPWKERLDSRDHLLFDVVTSRAANDECGTPILDGCMGALVVEGEVGHSVEGAGQGRERDAESERAAVVTV
jgi:hypothetical protein